MSVVLGLNAVFHEDAAAVAVDGVIVAAAEEERFNRRKHAKRATEEAPRTLPFASIDWALAQAGVSMADVDAVAYSFAPDKRLADTLALRYPYPVDAGGWGGESGERRFHAANMSVPETLAARYPGFEPERVVFRDHHLCHAASAFFPSGFEEAAVLVVDGIGETASAWLGHGTADGLSELGRLEYPASLGLFWERIAEFCGFDGYNASYLMGLAGYGGPSRFAPLLAALMPVTARGIECDDSVLTFRKFGAPGGPDDPLDALERHLGVPRRSQGDALADPYPDIAWAAQAVLQERLEVLASDLYARSGSRNLCMAGGVALNCVANAVLLERSPFDHLWVQPAANDAGTSVGAALLEHHQRGGSERWTMEHAYLGPSSSDDEIERALRSHGLGYRRSDDVAGEVAGLLADGAVVAWFQGRMEFGPRALGNRSLLADPRRADVRETLNVKVKHRETFRPFCPSVLAERAGEWFEIPGRSCGAAEYMLAACAVREEAAERIPAVVHVDRTARIQLVRDDVNPRFAALLRAFETETGVPLLLNTSFNDSEPIVCTIDDAISTFAGTQIDYLVAGDFIAGSPALAPASSALHENVAR